MSIFRPKSTERKYVDLFFRDRGKYLNLDPSGQIAVGDYGYIAKESGRFLKEGNIFKDNLVNTSQIQVPPKGGRVDESTMTTEHLTSLSVGGSIGADIQGFAECTFKARYAYESGAGAAVVMLNSVMTRIDNQGVLKKLFEEKRLPEDKAIVTEVHACPSYTLVLCGKSSGEALFGLGARVPNPSVPSANVDMRWVGKITTGELQSANDDNGQDVFFPVFELRGIKPRGAVNDLRKSEVRKEEQLHAYPTPWGPLDEEGNEVDVVPSNE